MQIDYDTIITNANKRKDDLKRIEELVNMSPDILEKARDVYAFTLQLKDAYGTLDPEGRKLLPQRLAELLSYSDSTAVAAGNAVSQTRSTDCRAYAGLEPISKFAQGE